MRRAERLFQIIQILRRSSRPVTADDMAGELEVSRRTVYRDVAELTAQKQRLAELASALSAANRQDYLAVMALIVRAGTPRALHDLAVRLETGRLSPASA